MIIIDTNIISEMMKVSPSTKVMTWMDKHQAIELFITTTTIAEIFYGINVLPDGNRKRSLEDSFNKTLEFAFKHRILSFDEAAAQLYGEIMGKRKMLGRPLSIFDGQIASIAIANKFSIATRNVRDFIDCEINLINPFE